MRLHISVDVYHHFPEGDPCMPNAALEAEINALSSALSSKDSVITSLSSAQSSKDSVITSLSDALGAGSGDSTAVSSAVSAAVDAEDSVIAGEISTILAPPSVSSEVSAPADGSQSADVQP